MRHFKHVCKTLTIIFWLLLQCDIHRGVLQHAPSLPSPLIRLWCRYAIAAYTISQAGIYFLTNTTISTSTTCGSGNMVRVYVNNVLLKTVTVGASSMGSFNSVLGMLNSGDVVYVAAGASADVSCAVQFSWDFSLQQFSSSNAAAALAAASVVPANSVVSTVARACEPTDVGAVSSYQGSLQVRVYVCRCLL